MPAAREHTLRLKLTAKKPSSFTGVMQAVSLTSNDPFNEQRVWPDGKLPSLRALGAIGRGMGTVIYSHAGYEAVKKAVDAKKPLPLRKFK
jgi:hypothetical protein